MLDKNKIERLCGKCIEHWGEESQFNQLGEECCELGAEINRFRRGRTTFEELLKEAVDVMLMTFQMRHLNETLFDNILEEKLERIEDRIVNNDYNKK